MQLIMGNKNNNSKIAVQAVLFYGSPSQKLMNSVLQDLIEKNIIHNMPIKKVHITKNFSRERIVDPSHFTNFWLKKMMGHYGSTNVPIKLVMGNLK